MFFLRNVSYIANDSVGFSPKWRRGGRGGCGMLEEAHTDTTEGGINEWTGNIKTFFNFTSCGIIGASSFECRQIIFLWNLPLEVFATPPPPSPFLAPSKKVEAQNEIIKKKKKEGEKISCQKRFQKETNFCQHTSYRSNKVKRYIFFIVHFIFVPNLRTSFYINTGRKQGGSTQLKELLKKI